MCFDSFMFFFIAVAQIAYQSEFQTSQQNW